MASVFNYVTEFEYQPHIYVQARSQGLSRWGEGRETLGTRLIYAWLMVVVFVPFLTSSI